MTRWGYLSGDRLSQREKEPLARLSKDSPTKPFVIFFGESQINAEMGKYFPKLGRNAKRSRGEVTMVPAACEVTAPSLNETKDTKNRLFRHAGGVL